MLLEPQVDDVDAIAALIAGAETAEQESSEDGSKEKDDPGGGVA